MFLLKKYIAVLYLLVFVLPMAINLHHTLETHEHSTVCHSEVDHHIHENSNTDCKLCDFTTFIFLAPTFQTQLFVSSLANNFYPSNYTFLSSFKRLYFSLRAPPMVV